MCMAAQTESDARVLMLTHPKAFDVVDLDPYGTPSLLLEPAVEAVADGGLLCVTATDTAVLCGNNSGTVLSVLEAVPPWLSEDSIVSSSSSGKLGVCRSLLGQVWLHPSQRRLLPRVCSPYGRADDSCCRCKAAQADSTGPLGICGLLHPNIRPSLLVTKSECFSFI